MPRLFRCFMTDSLSDQLDGTSLRSMIKVCVLLMTGLTGVGGLFMVMLGMRNRHVAGNYLDEDLSQSYCKNVDVTACRANLMDSGQYTLETGGWIVLAASLALSAELLYLKFKRNPEAFVSVNAVEEGEDHYIPRNYGATV